MARYVTHIRTDWSTEDAFAFMADLRNFETWDPGVASSEQVEGSGPALGAAYDVTVKGIRRNLTLRYELVEFQPGQRFVARAKSSRFESVDAVTVEPTDLGTVVTYDAELALNGLLSIGDVFLRIGFRRIGDRAAAGLRAALAGARVSPRRP